VAGSHNSTGYEHDGVLVCSTSHRRAGRHTQPLVTMSAAITRGSSDPPTPNRRCTELINHHRVLHQNKKKSQKRVRSNIFFLAEARLNPTHMGGGPLTIRGLYRVSNEYHVTRPPLSPTLLQNCVVGGEKQPTGYHNPNTRNVQQTTRQLNNSD
jgi:hypothetical protein